MADAGAREVAEHLLAKRKKSQPLSAASCGCIFRNPGAGAPSAGALIDRAGLKGLTVGGATVSPVHANFLVNSGGQTGTAADILQLIKVVKEKVCVWGGGRLRPRYQYCRPPPQGVASHWDSVPPSCTRR